MLLHDKKKDALVEVLDLVALIDPNQSEISGQVQSGQEEQDPEASLKADLIFPSGESLPRCWVDADYRNS
ncbi:MAG: acetyltransferase [Timaviella obliquedivisa GSE-PSE-MK23-08B]|nr:acetyltransferase [Timaviella obliquedivisa GSE-PSE-MK23-08B]